MSDHVRPPDLRFHNTEIPEEMEAKLGFEGLEIWREDDQLLIEASYDNGYASIWVELDAVQVQQLRDLLA